MDISDPKTLLLEQHAVRAERTRRTSTGPKCGSSPGYPSVQFAHVRSPLSPNTNWATFFAELGEQPGDREIDVLSNSRRQPAERFVQQRPRRASHLALGAIPTGEGVDLHYQSIGKRTLADGDALSLTVAKGKADYERIVEWLVPDNRERVRPASTAAADGPRTTSWDALRFKNPLAFPMTTGPATVTANGQFNGQRTSYWVNAGEETVLRVEKALSVRTRATENEQSPKDGGSRDLIWIGGRQYRKTRSRANWR